MKNPSGFLLLGAAFLTGCPKPPPQRYSSPENAPGVAMDRVRITRVDFEQETGLGILAHCFEIEETNPLEPGAKDRKIIAPLVGIAVDEDLVITGFSLEKLPE